MGGPCVFFFNAYFFLFFIAYCPFVLYNTAWHIDIVILYNYLRIKYRNEETITVKVNKYKTYENTVSIHFTK